MSMDQVYYLELQLSNNEAYSK